MTGRYPTFHGTRNNGTFRLSDDIETIAEALKQEGFATGAFVGAFVLDRRFGLEQGFDHYDDELPEDGPNHTYYYAERRAEEVVGAAVDWIRARRDERFFLWVHVFDPHAPYDPPSPYKERYSNRPYAGEVAYTDAALGPLIYTLASLDDEDGKGTAIVVTSDHGEGLGEHGESTHALFIYDATMKVPLILNGPGIPEGIKVDRLVRTVDIAPTIMEMIGRQPSNPLDGVSLLDRIGSGSTPTTVAYGETFVPRFNYNWSELRFLRTESYKLIEAPQRELYDLKSDPREQTNLWSANPPEVGQKLLSELQALISSEDDRLSSSVVLDDEAVKRLRSLGYLANRLQPSSKPSDRPDPKDRVQVFEQIQKTLDSKRPAEQLIEAYREVLSVEEGNAMARIGLANVLVEEGRLEEAAAEYRKLLEYKEIEPTDLENLAVVLLLLNRTEEALEVTGEAVKQAPWDLDLHVLRGEALEQAGRLHDAMEAYGQASALRPEDPENHWRHGMVALRSGDEKLAETDFRRALAKDASFQPALAALSRLLARDGRTSEALQLLSPSDSSDQEVDSPELKSALAEVYLTTGRFEEARVLLEEARTRYPDDIRILALLGSIYGRAGDLQKAEATLREAASLGGMSPEMRRNLALVYLRQGKIDAGITELRAASRDAPENPSIQFSLGNAYLRVGNTELAAVAFERALELQPQWPVVMFNLALAYEHAGETKKAIETYRRYLDSSSEGADEKEKTEARRRLTLLERRNNR
jgi:Flp pilus assembly protein TadD